MAPTFDLQTFEVDNIVMIFQAPTKLQGSAAITWEAVTSNHIREKINSAYPISDLRVGTNIDGSNFVSEPVGQTRGRRAEQASLQVIFDVVGSYRSSRTDLPMADLVGGAFDSEEDRAEYVAALKRTGDGYFDDIDEVRVEINGVVVTEQSDGPNLYIIIGASAGGACLVLLGALFYVNKRGTRRIQHKTYSTQGDSTGRIAT
jgi:hypothetical protein